MSKITQCKNINFVKRTLIPTLQCKSSQRRQTRWVDVFLDVFLLSGELYKTFTPSHTQLEAAMYFYAQPFGSIFRIQDLSIMQLESGIDALIGRMNRSTSWAVTCCGGDRLLLPQNEHKASILCVWRSVIQILKFTEKIQLSIQTVKLISSFVK